MNAHISTLNGVARCSRYAFGPNKLNMCGPDESRELSAYLREGATDQGLVDMLKEFKTLHPYLRAIAKANHIQDPFDERVVEAYWIGNELLEAIPQKTFYAHLVDNLGLKKKASSRDFDELTAKLPQGARMHHSFHVFNVYKRTGHMEILHTLESMDACRVSWGRVTLIDGPSVTVMRKPLILEGHQLALGPEQRYVINRTLDDNDVFDEVKIGDWVTVHWDRACEIVNQSAVRMLERYTLQHIVLANQTL
ncbi:MAG: DUF6390 family protein [Patescibacteria group bacterium]